MPNDIPNFNLLAVFSAVMEQGSLSKAADQLNTNQSTISTSLGRLKKEIGHDLFVRSGRGVVPTSYATSLYAEIQGPIQQLNGVFQGFGEFDPNTSVRNFVMTAPEHLQWILLRTFADRPKKNISLELFEQSDNDETMYDGLLTQKFDVMIDIVPPTHPNIESTHLFDGEFVIVCRKGHSRIKDVLSISQYMYETHAVLERTRNQMYTLGHYTSIDITKRKVAYHGRSMFSNMLLCSQSDYLTAVPLSMALQFEEHLQLQVLKPPFESKQISNYLIWLKKLKHDPSHKWFRNELISTVKDNVFQIANLSTS